MILADDLGWNDVPWHNPSVLAPHLNHLATSGVILEQHYVQPKCAPSRAALLTGRYPYRSVRLLYSPGSCAVKYYIYILSYCTVLYGIVQYQASNFLMPPSASEKFCENRRNLRSSIISIFCC